MASYATRKERLVKNIVGTIVATSNQTNERSFECLAIGNVSIACRDQQACRQCLLRSHSPYELLVNGPAVRSTKMGPCRGTCVCTIQSITQDASISLDVLSASNGQIFDPDTIATKVLEQTKEEFGDAGGSMDKTELTTLVTQILFTMQQEIDQTVHSIQVLSIDGTGTEATNIRQQVVLDATLKAVANACSSSDQDAGCKISIIDSLIQSQMDYIRNSVNERFEFSAKKVFNNFKRQIYTILLFLVILAGLLLTLFIKRAFVKKAP